jgi:hypothetical protein
MAAHWEQLARDRVDLIRQHPELAIDGEQDEEARHVAGRRPAPR